MVGNSQEIFSRTNDKQEWEFFLINHQEKAYCVIPKAYHGFCMKWYCSRENDLFNIYLSDKVKGYDFINFEDM
jgi:hypothetical protein